ncbi:MAG TPA: HAMP domain-containing sensor histidine kinase [Chthoniobacterales bacterium]|nr:HAMP domain-containing sensor histidine kinase [Chthoniobacterales bacterium]
MRKFALIFVLAVFLPSIVLGWLALDSLRNQEFVFERQQELLLQGTSDTLAERIRGFLGEKQNEFANRVDQLASGTDVVAFDERVRAIWPAATVGFVVTLDGKLVAPSAKGNGPAQRFLEANSRFLTNAESAEVYQQPSQPTPQPVVGNYEPESQRSANSELAKSSAGKPQRKDEGAEPAQQKAKAFEPMGSTAKVPGAAPPLSVPSSQRMIARSVNPQKELKQSDTSISNVLPAEAQFHQLIGTAMSGSVARFVGNELFVIFWHRTTVNPKLVFGAEVNLNRFTKDFEHLILPDYDLAKTVCVALLDDKGKPVVTTMPRFATNWKRPFVATEVGEVLPHWEIGVYLLNPAAANQIATTVQRSVGATIVLLLFAIGIGSWLIWRDLGRQIRLARQKTDFVSNVSHELKTPLTSIRIFSELLAKNPDPDRQKRYSEIIVNESSRLTRLINNVLDFARMDRGETKYEREVFDLNALVRETLTNFRPNFASDGVDSSSLPVHGNRDAVAQVLLNLLSNAEKYGDGRIDVTTRRSETGLATVQVSDRGPGVPHGSEEKIFEQFYRAHNSLSSGIQGAGLGLTLARRIARANGGDVIYEPHPGGGSQFSIKLSTAQAE